MADPRPIPFDEWQPDKSDRLNPTAEAKGVFSLAGQYAPFPDLQNYGPESTVDEFTTVLLHLDSEDGGTVIRDDGPNGQNHLWTASGNAHQDTGDKQFGASSLLCDGTGDFITMVDHEDITLGSGDWTIDLWFKCNVAGGTVESLAGQADAGLTAAGSAWGLVRETSNQLRFTISNGSVFTTIDSISTFTSTFNIGWHHVAIIRSGNTIYMFVDGVREGNTLVFSGAVNDSGEVLGVGCKGGNTADPWTGWIDEFRLSVGLARFEVVDAAGNDGSTWVLVHGDGADTQTFLADDAIAAGTFLGAQRVWTVGGNAQLDTAEKKFGASSMLFDGTGDWWRTPDSADIELGDLDFTIDFWFNCTAAGGTNESLSGKTSAAAGGTNAERSFLMFRNTSNAIAVGLNNAASSFTLISATVFHSTHNAGWHHVAFVRNGTFIRLFIDGVLEGGTRTITGDVAANDLDGPLGIGSIGGEASNPWTGWIDEYRMSIGVARYWDNVVDENGNDANTKILLHFEGPDTATFLQNVAQGAITQVYTAAGNAQFDTAEKKFGNSSGLFDGTGDWWTAADSSDFNLGALQHTIECWFNCTGVGGTFLRLAGQNDAAFTTATRSFLIQRLTTDEMQFTLSNATTNFSIVGSTRFSNLLNTGWHHIACQRSIEGGATNTMSLWIDGVLEARTVNSTLGTINNSAEVLGIGTAGAVVGNPWTGWIDEFRLSTGVARYSHAVSTDNDAFTKILIHFDGPDASTGIYDVNAGGEPRSWVAAGNAQLDTAQQKFGPSSLLCDGTTDAVTVADHADFTLAGNDWTIDCWFNCTATTGTARGIAGQGNTTLTAATTPWFITRTTGDLMQIQVSDGSTFTVATGQTQYTDALNTGWHHIAAVRDGDRIALFIDGIPQAVGAFVGSLVNSANALRIGERGEQTTNAWQGWIDEFRFSNGIARWPVAVDGNDGYTKILLNCDGADTSTTFLEGALGRAAGVTGWTANGNAQVDTADKKFGTGALLCDGTGDFLTSLDSTDYTLGSGDWTVDFWFKCTAAGGTSQRLFGQCDSTPTIGSISVLALRGSANTIQFQAVTGGTTTNFITTTGQYTDVLNPGWHHAAFVRSGTDLLLFIDGVLDGSTTISGTVNDSSQLWAIGTNGALTNLTWTGSIDEFRLSVGIARWTEAFTPPASAYTGPASFTPPAAAYGGASFVPPTAPFGGPSFVLPTSAYSATSFEPPTTAASFGGGAEDIVLGADTFYDSDTDPHIFFGDATRLYTLESRSAVDISQPGGYQVGDTDTWQFAQFGNNVMAVSSNVHPQHYVMGTSALYDDLAGTPPDNATSVARVGDFAWMGKDYTVYWSAFNDVTDWIPDLTTQAGSQELDQERGEIMCLVGLDYAAIFQERAIRRAIYVGGEVIWDFGQDYVEKARGCIARNAAVPWGRIIFYAADDGFYAFDGQSSTPIGYGKVDAYFSRNLNYSWRHKVSVGIDYSRKLVCFGFPTGSAQLVRELLIFSINDGRWTHDVPDQDLEFVFDTPAEPVTVDSFASIFPADDLDSDTVSPDDIDSAAFDDRRIRLAAFRQPDHRLGLYTGPPRAATIDTKEFEPMPGQRALLTEVWPLGNYPQGAVSSAVGYRRALPGAGVTFTNPTNVNRVGYCPQRIDARFMRIRQQITAAADWSKAEGIHFTATPTGKR